MIERIGKAIAVADGADFEADQARYLRLAHEAASRARRSST
jgi:hypothetical protein